jgi:hypothetical protein
MSLAVFAPSDGTWHTALIHDRNTAETAACGEARAVSGTRGILQFQHKVMLFFSHWACAEQQ